MFPPPTALEQVESYVAGLSDEQARLMLLGGLKKEAEAGARKPAVFP